MTSGNLIDKNGIYLMHKGRHMLFKLRSLCIPLLSIFVCSAHNIEPSNETYDVTVVSYILFANGLGRNAIAILDLMQDSLKMNFINTRPKTFSLQDVPENVKNLIERKNQTLSNVAILYDSISNPSKPHTKMPPSKIKLAYSMTEATAIPHDWASVINDEFDAVVVPDHFLVEVYKNSGVQKPIFVLPHPVYIDEFLAKPRKIKPQSPFTFGISCSVSANKNHEMVVDAFRREFGDSPDVMLKIHSAIKNNYAEKLHTLIREQSINNMLFINEALPWSEYIEFMSGLDCYVLVSKGEGFSVTPREALASGIPCIISNHTAHKTICQTGFVYPVKAEILEEHKNGPTVAGHNFNCRVEDLQKALREVFQNYNDYLAKARKGRKWVKQYVGKKLKKKYLNLFKPKVVLLGDKNEITDDFIMTDSQSLYNKYISIIKQK